MTCWDDESLKPSPTETITNRNHHQQKPSPTETITNRNHHQQKPSPTETITNRNHHQPSPTETTVGESYRLPLPTRRQSTTYLLNAENDASLAHSPSSRALRSDRLTMKFLINFYDLSFYVFQHGGSPTLGVGGIDQHRPRWLALLLRITTIWTSL
jgi:hypothetical protein